MISEGLTRTDEVDPLSRLRSLGQRLDDLLTRQAELLDQLNRYHPSIYPPMWRAQLAQLPEAEIMSALDAWGRWSDELSQCLSKTAVAEPGTAAAEEADLFSCWDDEEDDEAVWALPSSESERALESVAGSTTVAEMAPSAPPPAEEAFPAQPEPTFAEPEPEVQIAEPDLKDLEFSEHASLDAFGEEMPIEAEEDAWAAVALEAPSADEEVVLDATPDSTPEARAETPMEFIEADSSEIDLAHDFTEAGHSSDDGDEAAWTEEGDLDEPALTDEFVAEMLSPEGEEPPILEEPAFSETSDLDEMLQTGAVEQAANADPEESVLPSEHHDEAVEDEFPPEAQFDVEDDAWESTPPETEPGDQISEEAAFGEEHAEDSADEDFTDGGFVDEGFADEGTSEAALSEEALPDEAMFDGEMSEALATEHDVDDPDQYSEVDSDEEEAAAALMEGLDDEAVSDPEAASDTGEGVDWGAEADWDTDNIGDVSDPDEIINPTPDEPSDADEELSEDEDLDAAWGAALAEAEGDPEAGGDPEPSDELTNDIEALTAATAEEEEEEALLDPGTAGEVDDLFQEFDDDPLADLDPWDFDEGMGELDPENFGASLGTAESFVRTSPGGSSEGREPLIEGPRPAQGEDPWSALDTTPVPVGSEGVKSINRDEIMPAEPGSEEAPLEEDFGSMEAGWLETLGTEDSPEDFAATGAAMDSAGGFGEDDAPGEALEPQMMHCVVDDHYGYRFFMGEDTRIASGGLFVPSDEPFPVGTHVDIDFDIPDGPQITAQTVVAWLQTVETNELLPGMALAFKELLPQDEAAIEAYVENFGALPPKIDSEFDI
ncbi:MAG: PilZ domain-containing protein [Bradymonadia bacterium]